MLRPPSRGNYKANKEAAVEWVDEFTTNNLASFGLNGTAAFNMKGAKKDDLADSLLLLLYYFIVYYVLCVRRENQNATRERSRDLRARPAGPGRSWFVVRVRRDSARSTSPMSEVRSSAFVSSR